MSDGHTAGYESVRAGESNPLYRHDGPQNLGWKTGSCVTFFKVYTVRSEVQNVTFAHVIIH